MVGDVPELIARLSRGLTAGGIPFMLIGGQAVLAHGNPRLTEDVDVTLGVAPDELPRLLEACAEIELDPLPDRVEEFVRDTFVLPVRDRGTHIRVDLIFSTTPFEREAITRAVRRSIEGVDVPFATAEDLILYKLFASRPRDVEDAAGVVRRQGGSLDWEYLRRWAVAFSEVPGRERLPDQVEGLRKEVG